MTVVVFQDGTSLSTAEWEALKVRDEIFRNGILSLLGAKDLIDPSSRASIKYIEDQKLRKKIVARNGQSCW